MKAERFLLVQIAIANERKQQQHVQQLKPKEAGVPERREMTETQQASQTHSRL